MSEDDSQIHDEQPEVEPSAIESEPVIAESIEPEIEVPPIEPELLEEELPEILPEVEPPPPSKFRLFLNRALRWITGFMLVFVLGIVAMWVIRVRPAQAELKSQQAELDAMQDQITTLEDQVRSLLPLEDENVSLQAELAETEQQMAIRGVLVDVTSAQLAMAQEDPVAAKAALAGTDERLQKLDVELVGTDTLEGLRTRLALVVDELDSDTFAAQRDLQILANNLISLERSLFGE
ncbi:MAG: hypothetical protein AMJ88_11790 [Anaerolineae bacterium SM23_ 63]|nr:MAG: hypothetical protein AMJ88_11790 [Anaerolineae bacterium SM23_ 63]HEY46537.1 hypothetical protein [Anaerolineae bacterium]